MRGGAHTSCKSQFFRITAMLAEPRKVRMHPPIFSKLGEVKRSRKLTEQILFEHKTACIIMSHAARNMGFTRN